MPLYEYACDKCGKTFEVMQKMADPQLTVHAECGGTLERLLSAPALHFKGSGFYITDYAKGSQTSNAAGKAEGSQSESSKSDDGKKESKKEGSKSESSKSEGSKSDSGSSSSTPAPATTSSSSDSKS